MKEYARRFYSSKAWQRTRDAYKKSKRGLCEICLAQGMYKPCEIVHHKVELTPDNINNPDITLSWSNLQCVCREHHAEIHELYERKRRYKIDELGRVIVRES
jgi:5-methylcytosine-specific restriction endonuclease McrA